MEQATNNTQNDVIDLRELWQVLLKRKIMIFILTFLTTLVAIGYIITTKPVYIGNAILEIGQIVNEEFNNGKYSSIKKEKLDDIKDLKVLVSNTANISASIPKGTNKKATKLLKISSTGTDKSTIKIKLEKAISYILDRHKEMAQLYSGQNAKVKMTQLVGDITVDDIAIKPKKKLTVVVAFITGLMLSVFLAFFLEFIQGLKKLETETDK